jgi:transcriptional regulator GlxA family with amidase domain
MRISVLVLDDVFDLGLAAILDVFRMANELNSLDRQAAIPFEVSVVGLRKSVKTAQGLTVATSRGGKPKPDCVIVPAIGAKTPEALRASLACSQVQDACRLLRDWSRQGTSMAAACVGTFVLAEAGLLDHHKATTSWWLAPFFRERYPLVRLEESELVVKSGRVVTAGAALGHVDLALSLVGGSDPQLASLTASYLIADVRPSQAPYTITDRLTYDDPVVQRFEQWARARLARGFSLDLAARALAISKRTLARRVERVLGKSPLAFFQALRVERAVQLLKRPGASVDDIAAKVGYADGSTLRALLRRELKMGVRQIRG